MNTENKKLFINNERERLDTIIRYTRYEAAATEAHTENTENTENTHNVDGQTK